MNQVPHKGIGYGILKYLTAEENRKDLTFQLEPEILFNYFGEMETYSLHSMPIGYAVSPSTEITAKLDVSATITMEEEMLLSFRYNPHLYRPSTIRKII